jgi:hypothetical protein
MPPQTSYPTAQLLLGMALMPGPPAGQGLRWSGKVRIGNQTFSIVDLAYNSFKEPV